MSKSSYIFSYAATRENQYLTHKIRANDEKEAWRRFRFWSRDKDIQGATIIESSDPKWVEDNLGLIPD